MESNRAFGIYAISLTVSVLLLIIGVHVSLGISPTYYISWTTALPELSLGVLVRGYCGFFLAGDSFRWSLAGPS